MAFAYSHLYVPFVIQSMTQHSWCLFVCMIAFILFWFYHCWLRRRIPRFSVILINLLWWLQMYWGTENIINRLFHYDGPSYFFFFACHDCVVGFVLGPGEIPTSVGNTTSLTMLYLGNNELEGKTYCSIISMQLQIVCSASLHALIWMLSSVGVYICVVCWCYFFVATMQSIQAAHSSRWFMLLFIIDVAGNLPLSVVILLAK